MRIRAAQQAALIILAMHRVLAIPLLAQQPGSPTFEQIAQTVSAYFAANPDYVPGDQITARQVNDVTVQIAKLGWNEPELESLSKRALSESSFLARQFSTAKGQAFMRKIALLPNAYNQLDQLSRISGGKRDIRYLITHKDGYLLIKYLTTTRGGKKLGRQMANVKRGVDLNKPTGRIYTADQLLDELKTLYRAQFGKAGP